MLRKKGGSCTGKLFFCRVSHPKHTVCHQVEQNKLKILGILGEKKKKKKHSSTAECTQRRIPSSRSSPVVIWFSAALHTLLDSGVQHPGEHMGRRPSMSAIHNGTPNKGFGTASHTAWAHWMGTDEAPTDIKTPSEVFSSAQSSVQWGRGYCTQQKPLSKAGCFGKISSVHTPKWSFTASKRGISHVK